MKKIKTVFTLTAAFLTFILNAQEQQQMPVQQQQQLPKVKEYGIGFTGLNSYSLQYRWGNENKLYRLQGNIGGSGSVGNLSDNSSNMQDTIKNSVSSTTKTTTPINFNGGLSFSILKIKFVSEKFGFLYGGIYSINYSIKQSNSKEITTSIYNINYNKNNINTTTTKQNSQTFMPSVGVALGAVYKINSSFLLYAEIDPNLYYSYNISKTNTTSSTEYSHTPNLNNTQTTINGNPANNANPTNTFGLSGLTNSGASLTIVYRITK